MSRNRLCGAPGYTRMLYLLVSPFLAIELPHLLHGFSERLCNRDVAPDPLWQLPSYPRRGIPAVQQHERRPVPTVAYRPSYQAAPSAHPQP